MANIKTNEEYRHGWDQYFWRKKMRERRLAQKAVAKVVKLDK